MSADFNYLPSNYFLAAFWLFVSCGALMFSVFILNFIADLHGGCSSLDRWFGYMFIATGCSATTFLITYIADRICQRRAWKKKITVNG